MFLLMVKFWLIFLTSLVNLKSYIDYNQSNSHILDNRDVSQTTYLDKYNVRLNNVDSNSLVVSDFRSKICLGLQNYTERMAVCVVLELSREEMLLQLSVRLTN